MKISNELLRQVESDLGLNAPFIRGQKISIKHCWHFSTDGKRVDAMFFGERDFVAGMNRIYVVARRHRVIILAFALMDTHVHFILYGNFDDCLNFVREYLRRTSMYIQARRGDSRKLENLPVSYQEITDDIYLKAAICYTINNAPAAGLAWQSHNYPWSSGSLYFSKSDRWTSPVWTDPDRLPKLSTLTFRERRDLLHTHDESLGDPRIIGNIIFPGEYVAYELVERLFKTDRSFHYFVCKTKDEDVEARGGEISQLTISLQEMRQNKADLCLAMFGTTSSRSLDTNSRLRLARTLRARYNSSPQQIARLCGLNYEEVKGLI